MDKSIILNKKGNTLVIAIVLMIVMTAISLALSNVFLNELKLSANLDDAILAYYGAESGIEYGLYDARKTDLSLASSVTSDTFVNGVEWTRMTDDEVPSLSLSSLEKNNSIQLDFYNPDDTTEAGGIGSLVINWNGNVGSWVLLKATSWAPASSIDWSTKSDKEYLQANSPSSFIRNFDSSLAYKFKLTALQSDIQNLSLVAYSGADGTGSVVNIPNFLDITGKGVYKTANQAIHVSMPRTLQLSALYNYVIFTEESLIKEF